MKSMISALATFAATVSAHSSGYFLKERDNLADLAVPPPAISYHIHVVFDLSDPTSL